MNYAIGHNAPGYLPDSTVSIVETFAEAKAILISDLKFQEDYADSEDLAEAFCHAAEEVNLWSSPGSILVDDSWWIDETDEEVDESTRPRPPTCSHCHQAIEYVVNRSEYTGWRHVAHGFLYCSPQAHRPATVLDLDRKAAFEALLDEFTEWDKQWDSQDDES